MIHYVRNLSTFRLLVIFLLALASIVFMLGHVADEKVSQTENERHQQILDTLLECSENFGSRLAAQESLALALAREYEALEKPAKPDKTARILEIILASAPEYIEGVGIIAGTGTDASVVTYLPRDAAGDGPLIESLNWQAIEDRQVSARELNLSRRMRWSLISSPPVGEAMRFSTQLALSLGDGDESSGSALVRNSFRWLPPLLEKMHTAGAEYVFCVTPDREVLWLENGQLYFDRDFEPGENRIETVVARARQWLDHGDAAVNSGYIKSDIFGTDWHLLLMDGRYTSEKTPALPLSLLFIIILGGFLLLDAVYTTALPQRRSYTSMRTRILPARSAGGTGPAETGFLAALRRVHSFLFTYRMIDPNQERIDSELRVARQIQFSLVPDSFPSYSEWREFDLYSLLSPAREVGGDYYDFFMLDSNRMLLAVGDVSGKGVPAALYMAVCRTAFRTIARETTDPGDLMTRLNDMLVRDNQSGLYITLAAFVIDLPSGECRYSIAGHPAPLWHERAKGVTTLIDSPRETFIGMKPGVHFPVGTLKLSPGDTLLLYTDGVTEAQNAAGDELEYTGLKERFSRCAGAERCQLLISELEASVREFMESQEQLDDITLLAFRYWGPGGQKILRKREHESARMSPNAT